MIINILITIALTSWYLLAGLGFYKLLSSNKLGLGNPPLIFSLLIWPIVIVAAGLCKEQNK